MPVSWSRREVEAIVTDYFDMLSKELRDEPYNKSAHRRALSKLLNHRSDGSIERKHQNISAALLELGCPYIAGYKPLGHYQDALFNVVSERIDTDTGLGSIVSQSVARPAAAQPVDDILGRLEAPPEPWVPGASDGLSEPRGIRSSPGRRIDYLALEANNSSLGAAGEEFVVEFERARLRRMGEERLARRVEHVSKTVGDGTGFDVLSFEGDGAERLVEVKTTAYGKATPFYVTRNEVSVSRDRASEYHLYRVFTFRRSPRLYTLQGPLERVCSLDPTQFIARVS